VVGLTSATLAGCCAPSIPEARRSSREAELWMSFMGWLLDGKIDFSEHSQPNSRDPSTIPESLGREASF
jgi:hypothetical protein